MSNANFTNDVSAFANNGIDLTASSGQTIAGSQDVNTLDLTFTAGENILLSAAGDTTGINIDGNLTLNRPAPASQGGTINLIATGNGSTTPRMGQIIVTGRLQADASNPRPSLFSEENGPDAFGGTVNVDVTAAGVLQASNLDINTRANPFTGSVTTGQSTAWRYHDKPKRCRQSD